MNKGMKRWLFPAIFLLIGLAFLHQSLKESNNSGIRFVEHSQPNEILLFSGLDGTEIHYRKLGDEWVLAAPAGYTLDRLVLRDILEALAHLEPQDPFPPKEGLEAYGLGPEAWEVKIRRGFDEVVFRVGMGAGGMSGYLRFAGGEEGVFPISRRLPRLLGLTEGDFVDRTLLRTPPEEVQAIRIVVGGPVEGFLPLESWQEHRLLWDIQRGERGEWIDLMGDRALSPARTERLLGMILSLEGKTLLHRDFLGAPSIQVILFTEGDEKVVLGLNPEGAGWGGWGEDFSGFGLGDWEPALWDWHPHDLDRFALIEQRAQGLIYESGGVSVDPETTGSTLHAALTARWPTESTAAEPPIAAPIVLLAKKGGDWEMTIRFWPSERILQIAGGGTFLLPPSWWLDWESGWEASGFLIRE